MRSDPGPSGAPHDSWAHVYEAVMERTFGPLYDRLTSSALAEIGARLDPGGSVVDFGAGCGRLTVPLAGLGYDVTAVEPSAGMRRELAARRAGLGPPAADRITIVQGTMQEYPGGPHDLALCAFTVISYLLETRDLRAAFRAVHASLRPGGLFLLDVPRAELFADLDHDDAEMIRDVRIRPDGEDRFLYRESTILRIDGGEVRFSDTFRLRHWSVETVESLLDEVGFRSAGDVSRRFAGLGSDYLLVGRA